MSSIQRYQISVAQSKVDTLQKKLALTTLPDELDNSGWDYGAPLADIKRLVAHWQNDYDWRAHERQINASLPQYTISIDVDDFGPLTVHFVHQESAITGAIPLLFCHGWPGHFLEVSKILPRLVQGGGDQQQPAFHVVAPSLINYGFSDGVKQRGFTMSKHAEVCHKLMRALGYAEYVTQGGDWGYVVTRLMGHYYPTSCRASHLNMYPVVPSYKNPLLAVEFYSKYLVLGMDEALKRGMARAQHFGKEGMGYYKEQSTKPQTIGYSQADSPVGLLAWIYEKLHDWTDAYPWTDDEILTWVSIYAFSNAGPAAPSRTYYECMHGKDKPLSKADQYIPNVKLGVSLFPKEIAPFPTKWAHAMGPLVYQGQCASGGHFAAYEKPDAIVGDLRRMFGKGGGAYAAVQGKNGYSKAAL